MNLKQLLYLLGVMLFDIPVEACLRAMYEMFKWESPEKIRLWLKQRMSEIIV